MSAMPLVSVESPLAEKQIRWSLFGGCRNNTPTHFSTIWDEIISTNAMGRIVKCSGTTREEAKRKLPAFSPAAYPEGGVRGDRDLDSLQVFMLDFDNTAEQPTGEFKENGEPIFQKVAIARAPTLDEVHQHLTGLGVTHFGYHSFSSKPENERFRIMIPLTRPSGGKNWKVVSEWLLAQLDMEQWRSMGCLDLGALHRPACIYFTAGYWSEDLEAKDRICFVNFKGVSLDLPGEEAVANMVVAPMTIHPLRREWTEKRVAARVAALTGDPKNWFKPFKVDFTSLDIIALLREMGSDVFEPVPYKDGSKARCTCPFAGEHSDGQDHGDAAVFFGPGKWPGFLCMHGIHEGVGLTEICIEAGLEMVQRHAEPYRATEKVGTSKANGKHGIVRARAENEVLDGEILEAEGGDEDPEGRIKKRREHFEALLSEQGIEPSKIRFDRYGGIAPSRANLEEIFTFGSDYGGSLRWNELSAAAELTVDGYSHLAIDDLDRCLTALQNHMERRWETSWAEDAMFKVGNLVAFRYSYHPVVEYLEQLPVWDNVDRFPMVVYEILGASQRPGFAEFQNLYTEFMKCTFIGAVRRLLEPGCKMDTVTILYGEQEARKSSFWKALCVDPMWFNDSKIHIDSAEGMKVLQGSWIHELGEIDDMTSKKSAEAIKAFVSSSTDKFRASYGKVVQNHKRRCIFVGTTNKEEVLNDPTGSRRFWIIPVGKLVNMDLLVENREQIWAQAYKWYKDGVIHYLTPEFEALRVSQSAPHQMQNRFADLVPKIVDFFNRNAGPKGITLAAVFGFLSGKTDESNGFVTPNGVERRELAACLRSFGWADRQATSNGHNAKYWTPPGWQELHEPRLRPEGFTFPAVDLSNDPFKAVNTGLIL